MTEHPEVPQTTQISVPDLAPLTAAGNLIATAQSIQVETDAQRETALLFCKQQRERERAVDEGLETPISLANKTHKSLTKLRRDLKSPYEKARQIVEPRIDTFEKKKEAEAKAERERLEREAREREEAEQVDAAAQAEKAGETEVAAAIIEAPVPMPAVKTAPALEKVEGTSKSGRAKAVVVSRAALIAWVAKDIPNREHYLDPNMPALNRDAVSRKQNLNIPGVRVEMSTSRRYS